MRAAIGIILNLLRQRTDSARGLVEQCDLIGEGVSEETGRAQRHVNSRAAEHRQGNDLVSGDAARCAVPDRLCADQSQCLRDVVAAGAHVSKCPRRSGRMRSATRRDPGYSGRSAARRICAPVPTPPVWAHCGCRPNRNCARSAGRRRGRASVHPTGRVRGNAPTVSSAAPPFRYCRIDPAKEQSSHPHLRVLRGSGTTLLR